MLIPSIDLKGGAVVQLVQGERLAIRDDDVFRWVQRFERFPKVQVIDLDAAMGAGDNLALVRQIAGSARRAASAAASAPSNARATCWRAGAQQIIAGSSLFKDGQPDLAVRRDAGATPSAASASSPPSTAAAATSSSTAGRPTLPLTAVEAVRALEPYCDEFLYTHVDTEGLMGGTNLDAILAVRARRPAASTAAGGITTQEEIDDLARPRRRRRRRHGDLHRRAEPRAPEAATRGWELGARRLEPGLRSERFDIRVRPSRHANSYVLAFAVLALAAPAVAAAARRNRARQPDGHSWIRAARCGSRTSRAASRSPRPTGPRSSSTPSAARPRERLDRIRLDIHTDGSNVVVIDANQPRPFLVRIHRRQQRRRNRLRHQGAAPDQPRRRGVQLAGDRRPASKARTKSTASRRRLTLERRHRAGPGAHLQRIAWSSARKRGEPDQTIDVDTFSGNVELHVPDIGARQRLVQLLQRPPELGDAAHASTARAGASLRAELGGGGDGRTLRFKTFSGSVKIDR